MGDAMTQPLRIHVGCTRKINGDYFGHITVFPAGGGRYEVWSPIRRLSRGDGLKDARQLETDLLIENGIRQWELEDAETLLGR